MAVDISILISAYNAEKYVEEAIVSLLNQEFQSFEIVIADDGSNDMTRTIIDGFNDERLRAFHNNENIGKPKTIEKLLARSEGRIISIHDADDTSHPKRLSKMFQFLSDNPDLKMAGHDIQRMTEDGQLLPLFRKKSASYEEIKRMMEADNTDGDPSMFIRREIIPNIGGLFRPYFQNNMDYDLALRIIEKYKTGNLTEVLSYYRNVPGSISKGISSYKKLTTQKITQFLHKERKSGLADALERGDGDLIKQLENEFAQPYVRDQTLHLREMAAFFMYTHMNKEAIKYSLEAVKREPFKFVNLRTLQYCLRKTYLGI